MAKTKKAKVVDVNVEPVMEPVSLEAVTEVPAIIEGVTVPDETPLPSDAPKRLSRAQADIRRYGRA